MEPMEEEGEIRIDQEEDYLLTDEDAEFKRAILQLIFLDDIATLKDLLQVNDSFGDHKSIEDIYDLQKQEVQHRSVKQQVSSHMVNQKLKNLNWHDQHIKTNLDSKITPLTQAAYLGRKRIVEMLLNNFSYLDLNLPTIENQYTPLSAACMSGNCEIVQ